MRSPHDAIGRRALPHDPAHFIGTSDAIFFITICCEERARNQLCHSTVAEVIFVSARFYWERGLWGLPLLLLMPDHLHMLATFGQEKGMKTVIRNWKRYLATTLGLIGSAISSTIACAMTKASRKKRTTY
jgi:REP element-mobilizing transposase RayT